MLRALSLRRCRIHLLPLSNGATGLSWGRWSTISITRIFRRATSRVSEASDSDTSKALEQTRKDQSRIRNFCIIAHIDHGKSTLADRLLQHTNTISSSVLLSRAQYLDDMPLERERGITIKLRPVRMTYISPNSKQSYQYNLIDCPGHKDFAFEVGRSLAAVEGALLLVDASQGVQAQTVANVTLAKAAGLAIIPVINKIDLPNADIEPVREQIKELLGSDAHDCILTSAKLNKGIDDVLESIASAVPAPQGDPKAPLQALIFDSYYDSYRGVVLYLRIVSGTIKLNDTMKALSLPNKSYSVLELGWLVPQEKKMNSLSAGDVGYITAAMKSTSAAPVGDTITHHSDNLPAGERLPGYKPAKALIYGGLYPVAADDFELVRSALEKLRLSDSALEFQVETSPSMGVGFRVGFLGLLHADIVRERLRREFGANVMSTAPSVKYEVCLVDGKNRGWEVISNPADIPDEAVRIKEPFASLEILTPEEYVGSLMELCQGRRGELIDMNYFTEDRVQLKYDMPAMEIIADLADTVKSRSRGYASMDYSIKDYRETDLVKMNILVAKEKVDALAIVVSKKEVYKRGRAMCLKLKEIIPRAQFAITIQACVGRKVIASEMISAQRKDVTAKCYGGDVTRKKKLLKKQAEGKKRMKSFGRVRLSQDVFMSLVRAR